MRNFTRYSLAALFVFGPALLSAHASTPKGSVTGSADPGAQVMVTGVDNNAYMATVTAGCDGIYKLDNLQSGRYTIVELGPHHKTKGFSVDPGATAHIDLASANATPAGACAATKS